MKVYLVFRYVNFEGDDFMEAFDTVEKANQYVIEYCKGYDRPTEEIIHRHDGTIAIKGNYFTMHVEEKEVK